MIDSMTGFGRAEKELPNEKVVIEIRSVNSKTIDISTRIPHLYRTKESEIKNLISKRLVRGKVDVTISLEKIRITPSALFNKALVEEYMSIFREMAKAEDIEYLKLAIRMPDSFKIESEITENKTFTGIIPLIESAIEDLLAFRKKEGAVLQRDLELRVQNIYNLLASITQFDQTRIDKIRSKFDKYFNDLQLEVDANRLEQELIYYIEKLDITEERVRLKAHLDYFKETLEQGSCGRKLGFICQEIGREINTIGSKSNHADMQRLVVEMKDELEKIKEQSLNIL